MSSSSDEDLSKFSEATDIQLFHNSLFSENKGETCANVPVKSSLRYLDIPDENRTDLKVTPGFQKHVASRLMKILDSSLDHNPVLTERTSTPEHDTNGNCTSGLPPKQPEAGIKLFGASAAFLASCNITPPPPTRRRKRGRRAACMSSASEDDSSSNEADISNLSNKDSPDKPKKLGAHDEIDLSNRFAACAVSSEWILNGEAVKGWAPPHKNKEPIQGEATPDLIKMTSSLTSKSVKHKKKKRKRKKEGMEKTGETEQPKKRGKRGSRKKKKKMSEEIGNIGEAQSLTEMVESVISKPSEREKKRRTIMECTCDEVSYFDVIQNDRDRVLYEELKRSLNELNRGRRQETSSNGAGLDEFPRKKKKKKGSKSSEEIGNIGEAQSLTEMVESVISKPPERKKKRRTIMECTCDEVSYFDVIQNDRDRVLYEELKRSLNELNRGRRQETSSNGAGLDEFPRKKKKKKGSKSSKQSDVDESLNILLKRIKKKKRRKERENELPVPVLEDEGFDSDPTKADRKRRQQQNLLKIQLKRQKKKQKKSEKKWQNQMEYLSKDLANLMMTNVKED